MIEENKQIESFSDIKLTPAQAVELAEWIFANDTGGIFSADVEDDKPKQALLVLLSALAYDDDAINRENILFDVMRCVFGYSHAASAAENEFIASGFRAFTGGEWKPE